MEEEMGRIKREVQVKLLSQIYCNNEAIERIKAESKEEMKRLNAESKCLMQERMQERMPQLERLKSIYQNLKSRSGPTFKRTGNNIRDRSVAGCTKATSVTTTSVVTSSMSATAMNKDSPPVITLEELGQSPTSMFVCDICTDSTPLERSFSFKGCHHKYCNDCVHKYVASRLAQNIAPTTCPAPDCKGELEPDHCRSILPKEVLVKWCDKLCEAEVRGFTKLYCPYEDCSGMLIDDGTQKMIKESECPHCHRLFCAQCKVPWHSEINYEEFKKREVFQKRSDIKFMELAQTKGWKRCPKCNMYVEKTFGCDLIRCRCGAYFLYNSLYGNIVFRPPRNRHPA